MLTLPTWYPLCSLWICSVHGMSLGAILWPWIALLQSVLCLTHRAVEVFHVVMCGPVQQLPSLLPASVLRAIVHTCSNVSPDSSINISSISDAYIRTACAAIHETSRLYPAKRLISGPPLVTLIVVWTAYASKSTLLPEPQPISATGVKLTVAPAPSPLNNIVTLVVVLYSSIINPRRWVPGRCLLAYQLSLREEGNIYLSSRHLPNGSELVIYAHYLYLLFCSICLRLQFLSLKFDVITSSFKIEVIFMFSIYYVMGV
jgi:hypothetical protein